MNEAETRAERIDPKLKACGWGVVEVSKSKKLVDLEELKKSVLQKAFNGEL